MEPEVKAALAERSMDAIAVLEDVMLNSSNDNARVRAAAWFLEPFLPKQTNVNVNHSVSIADMLAEINQIRLKDDRASRTVIDITPTEDSAESLVLEPARKDDV
jgi:hypothetical protein